MIVLGVDPGSQHTGYGLIDSDSRQHRLLECGVLSPGPRLPLPEKLRHIHRGLTDLIGRSGAEVLAVEDCFHSANARTALVLGHVRGVVLLAGAEADLAVHEYAPATVKLQVAGSGRADKRQVAWMVTRCLSQPQDCEPGDATDALAVALCCALRESATGLPLAAPASRRRP